MLAALRPNQGTDYYTLPNPAKERKVEPRRDTNMLDILGSMIGKLQIMKDQFLAAAPTQSQIDPAEHEYHNFPHGQPPEKPDHPVYHRTVQPKTDL